ncbi:D-alanyl-D-alanine carboxypeptidase family protein [Tepidibacillus fermentans]|uniref:serine-type D-Ala-D-Ala carboxypeptidase n=1 Tax=Tepidibacillus fermentans TaxID=1281767 RepID=A0A4R3KKE1_9BACI|nr:D-alanyl-D-alanine carboxypeptidase family protein [Tepidibacillus fermentans]TCS84097.1 D-alanyl-D-alanine carboxypeptidase [Tepidibacillus fermentans]
MFLATKKRIFILIIFLFWSISQSVFASSHIEISAQGAALIDVNSGRILYEKNGDQRMRIASLTKIMTAIVAIENGNLKDMVTTSDHAFGTEGSSIYLKKGEQLTLEDMLYGLMLRSGNDAAVAIAEHIGGSEEGFVFMMNQKAAALGMTRSHFMNPHGLDHKEHYSTPKDMAILTAYALKNPIFKKIVSTKVKTAPLADEPWDRKWLNKNKLLQMYEYADGVKTGYTKLAKRCLASSATKNGVQLAAITLNAPDDWNDSIQLLEYGFQEYKQTPIVQTNQIIKKIKIDNKEKNIVPIREFKYPLKPGEEQQIKKVIELNQPDQLNLNNHIGKIKIYFEKKFIGAIPLQVQKEKETLSETVKSVWRRVWKGD